MDQSPLVLQSRPTVFKPKIVELYESLFLTEDDYDKQDGFWQEFFLHKTDVIQLRRVLSELNPWDLVAHPVAAQQLFARAIRYVAEQQPPQDETALETLTVLLDSILAKKYTSPSSDVIDVLTGIDGVDAVFSDFVTSLEVTIRGGRSIELRERAVKTAISTVCGAYRTALVSYFINRDMFPALVKLISDVENGDQMLLPLALLGILTNYNKFEFSNPYRLRLENIANDSLLMRLARGLGDVYLSTRASYITIQEDHVERWGIGDTLSYMGLGALTKTAKPTAKVLTEEEIQKELSTLPSSSAVVLITTYDLIYSNKTFGFAFVNLGAEGKTKLSPFNTFLSLVSYLGQNAHRSQRTSLYASLNFLILQMLVEDSDIIKKLSTENVPAVRLCRQRPPYLPGVNGERTYASVVLDVIVDTMNHNLRRRLDVVLYQLLLGVLARIISHLARSRTRLVYHWSELWRACTSLIKFLTQYSDDLKPLLGFYALADTLMDILALVLSSAEAFLPDPKSYDDLFYKVVEAGEVIQKFREVFEIAKHIKTSSVDILLNVTSHYNSILEERKGSKVKHLSPPEVSAIIKQGYDTLSIEAKEGLDNWESYREVDHRSLLKKVARVVVQDARDLAVQS